MKEELKKVMEEENKELKNLHTLLKSQQEAFVKKDVFKLESLVKEIENAKVSIAKLEVERRNVSNNKTMAEVKSEFKDEKVDKFYSDISDEIKKIQIQNDTNQRLLKRGLIFTNKMLRIFNPVRDAKTYNYSGKINR
ncbi:MAG: flagellar protein FlgN [Clostridium sp.]|nr:flagellar protein FlgN [Clostridium sp.]